jgi:hypothetical protein
MPRILKKSSDTQSRSLWQKLKDIAMLDVTTLARGGSIHGSLEKLEEVLIEADFGEKSEHRTNFSTHWKKVSRPLLAPILTIPR